MARLIEEEHGSELCAKIPGLYIRQDGSWTVAGTAGTVIPVRNPSHQIVALKVRADDGLPKYSFVSNANRGGPGLGSPVHFPLFSDSYQTVRVTEGEFKADVATVLSGVLSIGLPGVTNYRPAVSLLKGLQISTVLLSTEKKGIPTSTRIMKTTTSHRFESSLAYSLLGPKDFTSAPHRQSVKTNAFAGFVGATNTFVAYILLRLGLVRCVDLAHSSEPQPN